MPARRSAIQDAASREMKEKFLRYNLELEEVLIGTPGAAPGGSIEQILNQLRARQVAAEQVETYTRQQTAAVKELGQAIKLDTAYAPAHLELGPGGIGVWGWRRGDSGRVWAGRQ